MMNPHISETDFDEAFGVLDQILEAARMDGDETALGSELEQSFDYERGMMILTTPEGERFGLKVYRESF